MKKMDKQKADQYFREKNMYMALYFVIWFGVSFGVVYFAEPLSKYTFNGFPFHYFMGAQGAVVTFILLLFVNAKVSDYIDKKYGIDVEEKKSIDSGKSLEQ